MGQNTRPSLKWASEMKILIRTLLDHKRSEVIRQELQIFNLIERNDQYKNNWKPNILITEEKNI